jgi:hypothetical protein
MLWVQAQGLPTPRFETKTDTLENECSVSGGILERIGVLDLVARHILSSLEESLLHQAQFYPGMDSNVNSTELPEQNQRVKSQIDLGSASHRALFTPWGVLRIGHTIITTERNLSLNKRRQSSHRFE